MTITKERLERALIGLADVVDRYPEVLPLLERLEKDYDAMDNQTSAADRIRKKLGKTAT